MRRLALLALLLLSVAPRALAAQAQELRGRIIGADGQPLADQTVLLHRVVGSSGASIGQAGSDAEGRFTIAVDTTGAGGAVYFLAARWQDELYISEAFQAPLAGTERVLQVGVPGTSASALLEGTSTTTPPPAPPPGGGAENPWQWTLVAGVATILLGVLAYFVLRNRTAVPERRRVLARIAELDLRQGESDPETYRRRRTALLGQLRELGGP